MNSKTLAEYNHNKKMEKPIHRSCCKDARIGKLRMMTWDGRHAEERYFHLLLRELQEICDTEDLLYNEILVLRSILDNVKNKAKDQGDDGTAIAEKDFATSDTSDSDCHDIPLPACKGTFRKKRKAAEAVRLQGNNGSYKDGDDDDSNVMS